MRYLKINDIQVDIDDSTAIGIDLQSYDVKEPGNTFINVSNTFSIPITSNNLAIFGLANDPQSLSTKVYDAAICDYWIDNEKIIDQARIRVEEIQDRINLFIFEKLTFWESIKQTLWPDFVDDLLVWLNTEKGLPIETDPFTGLGSAFLDSYFTATTGVVLPYYLGNFANYKSVGQRERVEQTYDGFTSLSTDTVTCTITSNVISGSPIVVNVNIPTFTSNSTAVGLIVTALNNNSSISFYYDAIQIFIGALGTSEFRLIGKYGFVDAALNIAISSTFGTNYPTSNLISPGINEGIDFLEKTLEPAYGDVSGEIFLRRETFDEVGIGGHFCIYARTLFEFIESKYNINLLTSGGVLPGNVWDDVVAQKLFIPIRDLDVYMRDNDCYFRINRTDSFLPMTEQKDRGDKTVYDFVISFMKHLNVLKDEFKIGGENIIRFARFDDLELTADVVDFSDRLTGIPKFKPRIDGYAQENYIKFKEVYPEGDELINSKILNCLNVNLDVKNDLIEIDAYVPSIQNANSESISYAADKESFNTFIFYISDEYTANKINTYYFEYSDTIYLFGEQRTMQIAKLYDLDSEYNFLEEIISYPKFYEIKKWMTIEDIRNFEFFKQYYIRSLNGSFFINKIKGFNPDKSRQATTLELLKLGNRTPLAVPDLNYWTDGVNDAFVDGVTDYWF